MIIPTSHIGSHMDPFIEHISSIYEDFEPDKLLLYTDDRDFMDEACRTFQDVHIIIATNKPPLSGFLSRGNIHLRKTHYPPPRDFNVLEEAREVVLTCYAEGLLNSNDRVMLLISGVIRTLVLFDMGDIGAVSLKDELAGRIDFRVIEAVFKVGTMVVKEGKEGLPLGAMLILGDVNNVMKHTRELIKNPLRGCTPNELNIMDRANWSTIKEYSMLDGAIVLDEKGDPISAGRYVMFDKLNSVDVEEGLGGRHLAAAYISKKTRAVPVVISSESIIRIYKDGECIFRLNMI